MNSRPISASSSVAELQFLAELELPDHLRERTRHCQREQSVANTGASRAGNFVMYWMRTAVRSDENPALDVAEHLAERLQLPLLIYQAISDDYEFASDRHHRFMLEGARDVQRQLQEQHLSYAFHLTTEDDQTPHLLNLAQQAAWLITEDMPVDPPRRFLNVLLRKTEVPVLAVDTACVMPMQVVGRAYTRAFEFRAATANGYQSRVPREWPESTFAPLPFPIENLPFRSLDLQQADLSDLIARCRIDHAVGPIAGTPGGSTAGYLRWEEFKRRGLRDYARRRNNPLEDGVSRLSAYLHFGMVSPLRIAREAQACGNAGADKYLDELLIWRELAYCYCFYTANYDQWEALPDWARNTLSEHASDPRPALYAWEQLARAQTEDLLWNAAQESLLAAGELHNNVRMTWGKEILNWTRTPQDALKVMIDLNHRYALDGRDPASYGGLLWCLGQFDRPFHPQQAIFGTVRPRPTAEHARRLDVERYRQKVQQLNESQRPAVAVIGAGISGLIAARTLADHGLTVTVFEKSRGVGGRMATRWWNDGTTFDHGAQYFTARDDRFRRYVESWQAEGIVAQWPEGDQTVVALDHGRQISDSPSQIRYVGVSGMTAVARHLAKSLTVRFQTRIAEVRSVRESQHDPPRWSLYDEQGQPCGNFDRVLVAMPAPQAALLLADFTELARSLQAIDLQPCWALLAQFSQAFNVNWVGAFLHNSPLSWTSRNGTKPRRQSVGESVVIHATPNWTREHFDCDADEVATMMLEAFWSATGLQPQNPLGVQAHRWRYAIPSTPLECGVMTDISGTVIACGDWCAGARVEGAFLSGMAAAGRVLNSCQSLEQEPEITQLTLF
jgi:photolyase PhrII